MPFGPLQIFTFGFPDTSGFEGRIAVELIKLSDAGTIRIIDALAVVADGDEVDILRVSDLDEEQRRHVAGMAPSYIRQKRSGPWAPPCLR